MQDRIPVVISLSDGVAQYDAYLLKVRGLSKSTRNLHRHVVHMLLSSSFPSGYIAWSEFCFGDVVQFVTTECQRLTSRATQRVWSTHLQVAGAPVDVGTKIVVGEKEVLALS